MIRYGMALETIDTWLISRDRMCAQLQPAWNAGLHPSPSQLRHRRCITSLRHLSLMTQEPRVIFPLSSSVPLRALKVLQQQIT